MNALWSLCSPVSAVMVVVFGNFKRRMQYDPVDEIAQLTQSASDERIQQKRSLLKKSRKRRIIQHLKTEIS